jgi:hypothetical protein
LDKETGRVAFAVSPGDANVLKLWVFSYTSRRLKMSSFSRHEHLEQPRQQTSRIATPAVAITARMLPLVVSQCKTVCIEHTPESYRHRCRLGAVSLCRFQNLPKVYPVYH